MPPPGVLPRLERPDLGKALLFILVVSVAMRALVSPHFTIQGGDCDGAAFLGFARNIAAGAGYVTNSLYLLWNTPRHFPWPESIWSPLYSYLVAAASFLTHHDYWQAGKLVSFLFGISVP